MGTVLTANSGLYRMVGGGYYLGDPGLAGDLLAGGTPAENANVTGTNDTFQEIERSREPVQPPSLVSVTVVKNLEASIDAYTALLRANTSDDTPRQLAVRLRKKIDVFMRGEMTPELEQKFPSQLAQEMKSLEWELCSVAEYLSVYFDFCPSSHEDANINLRVARCLARLADEIPESISIECLKVVACSIEDASLPEDRDHECLEAVLAKLTFQQSLERSRAELPLEISSIYQQVLYFLEEENFNGVISGVAEIKAQIKRHRYPGMGIFVAGLNQILADVYLRTEKYSIAAIAARRSYTVMRQMEGVSLRTANALYKWAKAEAGAGNYQRALEMIAAAKRQCGDSLASSGPRKIPELRLRAKLELLEYQLSMILSPAIDNTQGINKFCNKVLMDRKIYDDEIICEARLLLVEMHLGMGQLDRATESINEIFDMIRNQEIECESDMKVCLLYMSAVILQMNGSGDLAKYVLESAEDQRMYFDESGVRMSGHTLHWQKFAQIILRGKAEKVSVLTRVMITNMLNSLIKEALESGNIVFFFTVMDYAIEFHAGLPMTVGAAANLANWAATLSAQVLGTSHDRTTSYFVKWAELSGKNLPT